MKRDPFGTSHANAGKGRELIHQVLNALGVAAHVRGIIGEIGEV